MNYWNGSLESESGEFEEDFDDDEEDY